MSGNLRNKVKGRCGEQPLRAGGPHGAQRQHLGWEESLVHAWGWKLALGQGQPFTTTLITKPGLASSGGGHPGWLPRAWPSRYSGNMAWRKEGTHTQARDRTARWRAVGEFEAHNEGEGGGPRAPAQAW